MTSREDATVADTEGEDAVRDARVARDLARLRATVTDEEAAAKWAQIAPLIDRLMERAGTKGEFTHRPDSALAGDDKATDPYNTSHAFLQSLTSAIDHLHAAKSLVHGAGLLHLGAPATLARSAIENAATAWWILAPRSRDERVLRTLRWYSRNFRDQHTALDGTPVGDTGRTLEDKLADIRAVAARRRGVNVAVAAGGYKMSTVITEHDQTTVDSGSLFLWQLASGFAHGRTWAYLGALAQERHRAEAGIMSVRLTNTVQVGLYPTLTALHTVQDALRLWQSRAGMPLPDARPRPRP